MSTNWLNQQISLIEKSFSLKIYGFFLSLTHVWTFLYWQNGNFFLNAQGSRNSEPLCFPFFKDCDLFRALIPDQGWVVILWLYALIAILTSFFFLKDRLRRWGFYGLIFLTFFKFALHMSNYNFMGNYHYMIYILSVIYLFLPDKKKLIIYALVSFYFAAGLLKVNPDWLSGAAMIATPWLNGQILILSLFYVIFLELFFIFGLFFSNLWVRLFVLLQLLAFHAFSWHIVGFFYPMVMFSALSFIVLQEYEFYNGKDSFQSFFKPFFKGQESRSVYSFLIIFWFLQLLPFLLSHDPALTGAPRLSSLNMFDAKTECHLLMIAHKEKSSVHLEPPIKNLGVRMGCDPIVFLNQAHQLCRKNKESSEFNSLSLHLFSKRVTQTDFQKILSVKNVCDLKNPLWAELSGSVDL